MDQNWLQNKFQTDDLNMTVNYIHVCVRSSDMNADWKDESLPPLNHWIIFLEIAHDHSVRMNMTPGGGPDGLQGELEISTKRYMFTDQTIHRLSFPTRGEPKVEDFVKVINANGLQKYDFHPEWEGCRFWVYTFISRLEREGVVEAGSAVRMKESIPYYYVDSVERIYREPREGKFRSM
ncbi:hypothetical protein E4U40_004087 [Claviceps sp. LM458 group G5]|nr:hypothetical protein E4U40_004087 [Claviceps sp. LM458 group G5]